INSGILQSTTSLIIAIDASGKHIVFNSAAEKALGYTKEEVLEGKNTIFLHDMEEIHQRANELSNEYKIEFNPDVSVFTYKPILEGAESRDWTLIRKNGTCFRANITVTPLKDNEGKITGFLGVIEDVTERLRQQQIIKASEETFRAAMEHASIGMALVSPNNKLLKVNEALCTILGYTKSALLVRDLESITHPDDVEINKSNIKKMLKGEFSSFEMEKRYIHSNGHTIWTLVNVSLVRDSENQPKYFIKQVQNISDRKEMERMKSEFISIVSHELRTPLTSIRGSLGLMVGTMTKDIPEKANRLIEIAYKNSERLILLINDILDIDKIASGQMRFDIKPEKLNSLVKQAIESNNDYAKKFNIDLFAGEIDPTIVIKVDSARFLQVMANLISNAAKFSITDGQVEVSTQLKENRIRINVKDYGMGIPKEFHSKIFSKFSQADSSATRVKGGTGLGLHITKQLIEYMNGEIGFDTEIGIGTTFWIDFPVSYENVQVIPLQSKAEAKKKILICENEKEIAELMQRMLNNAGFESDIAFSIFEAKRILKNQTYSAMTLDIVMPMGNGIDFIRELREEPRTSSLPIIVVSGQSSDGKTGIQGSVLGVAHLLQKPVDENILISCLRTAVDLNEKPKILHIEDDVDLSKVLEVAFQDKVELVNVTSLAQAQNILMKEKFSLIILDLGLPDGSGLSLLSNLHQFVDAPPPVVILSAHETSQEIQNRVSAALVKSRMSEEKIVETIQNIIKRAENKLVG
ncbi:MAG: PAS domain S-box protein, partial [Pseudomonadota bacterium]